MRRTYSGKKLDYKMVKDFSYKNLFRLYSRSRNVLRDEQAKKRDTADDDSFASSKHSGDGSSVSAGACSGSDAPSTCSASPGMAGPPPQPPPAVAQQAAASIQKKPSLPKRLFKARSGSSGRVNWNSNGSNGSGSGSFQKKRVASTGSNESGSGSFQKKRVGSSGSNESGSGSFQKKRVASTGSNESGSGSFQKKRVASTGSDSSNGGSGSFQKKTPQAGGSLQFDSAPREVPWPTPVLPFRRSSGDNSDCSVPPGGGGLVPLGVRCANAWSNDPPSSMDLQNL